MSRWTQGVLIGAVLCCAAPFAMAENRPQDSAENCAPRDNVVARLQSEYSEQLTMGGLQATEAAESVMEVWASQKTGTFTVLITSPDGLSCIVAAGTDFFNAGWAPAQRARQAGQADQAEPA